MVRAVLTPVFKSCLALQLSAQLWRTVIQCFWFPNSSVFSCSQLSRSQKGAIVTGLDTPPWGRTERLQQHLLQHSEELCPAEQQFHWRKDKNKCFYHEKETVPPLKIWSRICKRLRGPKSITGYKESSPPGWESIPGLLKRFTNSWLCCDAQNTELEECIWKAINEDQRQLHKAAVLRSFGSVVEGDPQLDYLPGPAAGAVIRNFGSGSGSEEILEKKLIF